MHIRQVHAQTMAATLSFDSERDPAMDLALSARNRLQSALDSTKHGISSSLADDPITIRELLYGGIEDTRTIAIDYNTSRYMVLYKWHSLVTIKLKDVLESMSRSGAIVVKLSKQKLDLYVTNTGEVAQGLAAYVKEIIVASYDDAANGGDNCIVLSKCPSDVLNKVVRRTTLDCTADDLSVTGKLGTIHTTFRG